VIYRRRVAKLTILRLEGHMVFDLMMLCCLIRDLFLCTLKTCRNRTRKARRLCELPGAPYSLGRHFLAVTRSAILSYSVFGMMRRVTSSPGSS